MRLNVTKVLDRVAHQLQKSSMLDDPIKLIYSVMHSNDCIARALTLRYGNDTIERLMNVIPLELWLFWLIS